jgi:hypothetical protein
MPMTSLSRIGSSSCFRYFDIWSTSTSDNLTCRVSWQHLASQ